MLRIDVRQEKKTTNFILTGKLTGPWVAELERCWKAAVNDDSARLPIVLDLSKVNFIDEAGKKLIVQMCQQGIKLVGTGLIAKFFCKELKSEARKCEPGK